MNKLFKIFGIEILFGLLFILVLSLFAPSIYNNIIQVKSSLVDYQSNVPYIDPNNATNEELTELQDSLVNINSLKDSITSFTIIFAEFLLLFLLLTSFLSAWQSKILNKKQKYSTYLWKWSLISLGLFIFILIYFWLMSIIFSKINIEGTGGIWFVFWFLIFLFSLKYMASFLWITKRINLMTTSKTIFSKHWKFVLIFAVYIFVFNLLFKYSFASLNIVMLPFMILYLILGGFIVAYEKVHLIKD